MGVNFSAVLDYAIPAEQLHRLTDLLSPGANRSLAIAVAALETYLHDPDLPLYWHFPQEEGVLRPEELWQAGSTVDLDGPAGLSLTFGRQCCTISNIIRWWRFLTDAQAQQLLRQVCFELGNVLRSTRAIYVPDSMFVAGVARSLAWGGHSLLEIETHLLQTYGPAATTITAIGTAPSPGRDEGDGYFIEVLGARG